MIAKNAYFEIGKIMLDEGIEKNRKRQIYVGKMTKAILMTLPVGCILMSNGLNQDMTPTLTEEVGTIDTRDDLWQKLKGVGYAGKLCYVFDDWAGYRAHLSSR